MEKRKCDFGMNLTRLLLRSTIYLNLIEYFNHFQYLYKANVFHYEYHVRHALLHSMHTISVQRNSLFFVWYWICGFQPFKLFN